MNKKVYDFELSCNERDTNCWQGVTKQSQIGKSVQADFLFDMVYLYYELTINIFKRI
jgi:hypothetical protein